MKLTSKIFLLFLILLAINISAQNIPRIFVVDVDDSTVTLQFGCYRILLANDSDSLRISSGGIYWDVTAPLDSALLDSITNSLGRFSGSGSSWNWEDSSGEAPYWVDSAKHADSAYNADSLGHHHSSYFAQTTESWDWGDSSSHGPDSVLFADSAKHADSADGAERATKDGSGNNIESTYETIINVGLIGDDTTKWNAHTDSAFIAKFLATLYGFFGRSHFDTLIDAQGDSIIVTFADSAGTVNATDIATGTLANARLTSDVSLLDQTIGTSEIEAGAVTDAKIDSLDPDKLEQDGASSGQILKWNGTAWQPGTDNTAGAYVDSSAVLARVSGDFPLLKIRYDSVYSFMRSATDSFLIMDSAGTWIIGYGTGGWTTSDSFLVKVALAIYFGSDSLSFPDKFPTDSQVMAYVQSGDSIAWLSWPSGGSGSIDSAGFDDGTGAHWSVDKAWKIVIGDRLAITTFTDSAGIDTATLSANEVTVSDSTAGDADTTTGSQIVAALDNATDSALSDIKDTGDIYYQPIEATLTDIADGTIEENLVNTANPWADNEIASSGNWNTAYGWGNHGAQGYINALIDLYAYFDRNYFDTAADAGGDSIVVIYSDHAGTVDTADAVADGETKPVTGNAVYDWVTAQGFTDLGQTIEGNELGTGLQDSITNGQTAYGWGNHASQNYLDNDNPTVDTALWNNVATLFDTSYISLIAGGQTIDDDTSIVSEGELEDSLDDYSTTSAIASLYPDTAEVVDTIQGTVPAIIGDSLNNYFDTAAVVDTVQGMMGNYVTDANLTDSLDAYFDTAAVIDSVQGLGYTSNVGTVTDAILEDSLDSYFDTSSTVDTIQGMMESYVTDANLTDSLDSYFDSAATVDTIEGVLTEGGYLTAETDPVWVSDSADYAFKTWVQTEIEDTMNEYSLTSDISSTYETITNVGNIGDDTATWKNVATLFDTSYLQLSVGNILFSNDSISGVDVIVVDTVVVDGDVIKDFTGSNLSVTDGVLNAASGGTTDSTRVGFGLKVKGTSGDSIAAPTDTIYADTTNDVAPKRVKDSVAAWDNRGYPDASTSDKGIASFGSSYFNVFDGSVGIKANAITATETADDAVDPNALVDSNVQAQGDIVTVAASDQFGFKTISELSLVTTSTENWKIDGNKLISRNLGDTLYYVDIGGDSVLKVWQSGTEQKFTHISANGLLSLEKDVYFGGHNFFQLRSLSGWADSALVLRSGSGKALALSIGVNDTTWLFTADSLIGTDLILKALKWIEADSGTFSHLSLTGSITGVDSLDVDSGLYVSDDITVTGTVDGIDISEFHSDYATDSTKLDGIEAGADVTDATNVNSAGAVMESDFDATTFLYATSDNTPQPKTPSEVRSILNVEDGATADQEVVDSAIIAADAYTAHKDKDGDTINVSSYEVQLNNEAGLYGVLSDVSDFLQLSDTANGVSDGEIKIVTGNAVYDWVMAQSYLTTINNNVDIGNFIDTTTKDTIENAHHAVNSDTSDYASNVIYDNLFVKGRLRVSGPIEHYNEKIEPDTSMILASLVDTIERFQVEESCLVAIGDSFKVLHPKWTYIPRGYLGWTYWATVTGPTQNKLNDEDYCENIYIFVKNEGERWHELFVGPESTWNTDDNMPIGYYDSTLHNPVFQSADFDSCMFTSDPHITPNESGSVFLIFRVTRSINGNNRNYLYCSSTDDGLDWSDTTMMVDGTFCNTVAKSLLLLCPCVLLDSAHHYLMYTVEDTITSNPGDSFHNTWTIWEAPKIDTLWRPLDNAEKKYVYAVVALEHDTTQVSIVQWDCPTAGSDTVWWHGDFIQYNSDLIIGISCTRSTPSPTYHYNFMGLSRDGEHFNSVPKPIYTNSDTMLSDKVYRASPIVKGDGLDVLVSGMDNSGWHTVQGHISFGKKLDTSLFYMHANEARGSDTARTNDQLFFGMFDEADNIVYVAKDSIVGAENHRAYFMLTFDRIPKGIISIDSFNFVWKASSATEAEMKADSLQIYGPKTSSVVPDSIYARYSLGTYGNVAITLTTKNLLDSLVGDFSYRDPISVRFQIMGDSTENYWLYDAWLVCKVEDTIQ